MKRTHIPLVAGLLILTFLSPSAAAQWPSFMHDERNTGDLGGDSYGPYKAVWWERAVPGAIQVDASPVVQDGVVIVADWNKRLWALDASTGTELWNVTFPAKIQSTPAVADNSVYAVDTAGNLKQFSLTTGALLDEAKVGATVAPLKIHQGKLYVGDEAGTMWALFTSGLNLNWKFATNSVYPSVTTNPETGAQTCSGTRHTVGPIQGAAAIHQGQVIFGTRNNHVYAVNENGNGDGTTTIQWAFKTNDAILGSPTVDQQGNRVVVGSFDNKVYSIPTTGGGTLSAKCQTPSMRSATAFTVPSETESVDSRVQGTPAVSGDRVFVGALNGYVYALNRNSVQSAPLWKFYTGNSVSASPAVANGHVVVANDGGRVVWLNAANGSLEAEYQINAQIKASPALVQDRTYIAGFDGTITMLGATIPERPDLTIENITWDGATNLSVIVKNSGPGEAPPVTVRVDLDNTFLVNLDVDRLSSGASQTLTHTISGPPATFTLKATADPKNVLAEAEEENNVREYTQAPPAPSDPTTTEGTETEDPGTENGNGGGRGSPGLGSSVLIGGLLAAALVLRRRG